MSNHLSQQPVESYLWGAGTLLRGLVDASDYKQYIFPPLFFKRLSDIWDEELRFLSCKCAVSVPRNRAGYCQRLGTRPSRVDGVLG